MYGLSDNPSMTAEFIERNIDKPWEWGYKTWGLSSNLFLKDDYFLSK